MSGDINENTNLSSDEVSTSTPTEQEATVPEPELMSELKSEILGGVGEGIVEAVTEEAMGKQQLRPQTQGKPKKQAENSIMKIQKSLADTSKQIETELQRLTK